MQSLSHAQLPSSSLSSEEDNSNSNGSKQDSALKNTESVYRRENDGHENKNVFHESTRRIATERNVKWEYSEYSRQRQRVHLRYTPPLRRLSQYFDKYNFPAVFARKIAARPRFRLRNYSVMIIDITIHQGGWLGSWATLRIDLASQSRRGRRNPESFDSVKSRGLVLAVALTCGANGRGAHWI